MERYKLGDIDNEQFYMVPKSLFTNPFYSGLGANAKLMYALLKDRMHLSRSNGWADSNGEIYLLFKQAELQYLLDISHMTCVKAMKQLETYELIDVVRQGQQKPNKIYIRKSKNYTSGSLKTILPEVQKLDRNNTEMNNTEINNKKEGVGLPATTSTIRQKFVPPTVSQVRDYCIERCNSVDPDSFVDFYVSKGWKVGNQSMKDWKAAVRTWERREKKRTDQPRRLSRAERQRLEDAELERMCREYDSGNGQTSTDDIAGKLSR